MSTSFSATSSEICENFRKNAAQHMKGRSLARTAPGVLTLRRMRSARQDSVNLRAKRASNVYKLLLNPANTDFS